MRYLTFVLLALLLSNCRTDCPKDLTENAKKDEIPVPDGWSLVWNSEFDSDEDLKDWNLSKDCNGCGNNELQFYANGIRNVFIEDGMLHLAALKESVAGKKYTSGKLDTRGLHEFTFGRFEIRAKLPYGQGIWPAIWMMPADSVYGGWPRSGEIDIMEAVSLREQGPHKIHGTIHYGAKYNNKSQRSGTIKIDDAVGQFHVYALEWDHNEIRWYMDGKQFGRADLYEINNRISNPKPAPFNKPFYFILNLAVGGNWPGLPNSATSFPQTMQIDYVRAFRRI